MTSGALAWLARIPRVTLRYVHSSAPRLIGRYALFAPIASGGMATVHLGRLFGAAGFSRVVAIKRLHRHLAADDTFVSMLVDEARISSQIRHPNVVTTLDVVAEDDELLIVMEYVEGESLASLIANALEKNATIPCGIATQIVVSALHGLHAAHEATTKRGEPLDVVHRDVSPQNLLVGFDGVVRVADFGVAKAAGRLHTTRFGELKGKLAYMAPEQFAFGEIDRRVDVYAAAVVLWELLTGRRLFKRSTEVSTMYAIANDDVPPPSTLAPEVPPELDEVVMRGLARDPAARFSTAEEMALALEDVVALPRAHDVAHWIRTLCADHLSLRSQQLEELLAQSAIYDVARPSSPDAETARLTTKAARGRRRTRVVAALAAVGFAAAGLLLRFGHSSPAPAVAVAAAAETPAPSVAPAVAETAAPPPALPTGVAAAEASASVDKRAAKRRGAGGASLAAARTKESCEPPFYLDPSGIKIPKPACLR